MKKTYVYCKDAGKVVETTGKQKELKEKRFHIGGQSGFKWKTTSQNKTWIENGEIRKYKEGKRITE
tara:strand:+ start:177 stop:374 length:198 start_codon:yes stop_codon:yes gene_type:complete